MVNLKLSIQLAIWLCVERKPVFKTVDEGMFNTTALSKQPWEVADIIKYKDIINLPYKKSCFVIGRELLPYFDPEAAKRMDGLERELSKDIENSRENVRQALEKIIREDFLNYG